VWMRTTLILLRIRSSGGLLWAKQWTVWFHKRRGISSRNSQEQICSMETVTIFFAARCFSTFFLSWWGLTSWGTAATSGLLYSPRW
jgi:hypothetical protein